MLKTEIKVHEIADLLVQRYNFENQQLSLFSGSTGIALFLFYYSRFFNNVEYAHKANKLLCEVLNKLELNIGYTFCEGISGICWCIDHLIKEGFIEAENNIIISYFDSFLANNCIKDLKRRGNNDFLHGAVGTATYLLNRVHVDQVKKSLEEVIFLLSEQIQNQGEHYFWNYLIGPEKGIPACNISLSHGMAGTGMFLVKARQAGIDGNLILDLLKNINLFFSAQTNKGSNRKSMFPSFSQEHGLSNHWGLYSRLGWCYGDLGIGLFFLHLSNLINSNELKEKALETLLFSAKRMDLEENSVFDGGICHGTAGIALIFRRIYFNTKLHQFKNASEFWLENTLLMAKYDDGLAGYKANKKTIEYGFLDGVAGIGLVLLSFLADDYQKWDECLLLS